MFVSSYTAGNGQYVFSTSTTMFCAAPSCNEAELTYIREPCQSLRQPISTRLVHCVVRPNCHGRPPVTKRPTLCCRLLSPSAHQGDANRSNNRPLDCPLRGPSVIIRHGRIIFATRDADYGTPGRNCRVVM